MNVITLRDNEAISRGTISVNLNLARSSSHHRLIVAKLASNRLASVMDRLVLSFTHRPTTGLCAC